MALLAYYRCNERRVQVELDRVEVYQIREGKRNPRAPECSSKTQKRPCQPAGLHIALWTTTGRPRVQVLPNQADQTRDTPVIAPEYVHQYDERLKTSITADMITVLMTPIKKVNGVLAERVEPGRATEYPGQHSRFYLWHLHVGEAAVQHSDTCIDSLFGLHFL